MFPPRMARSSYMKMVTFIVLFLWLTSHCPTTAKVYTRCQLVKELTRFAFHRNIRTWICIIENESGRSTNKIHHIRSNGTNYGIFQINSVSFCKKRSKGGLCEVKCEDLLNDELSDDVKCAKRVYDKYGFGAWPTYQSRCKGRTPPSITGCK